MSKASVALELVDKDLTPEDKIKAWKDIYEYYADPNCKKCFRRGWIGIELKSGEVYPCMKPKCAHHKLMRDVKIELLKQRAEERKKIKEEKEENKDSI